jgi:hypothetical protein
VIGFEQVYEQGGLMGEAQATAIKALAGAPGAGIDQEDHAAHEARFQALMRMWWLDERPGWTEPDWWDVPVRDEVRPLLWMPAGPLLAEALSGIGRIKRCVGAHPEESGDVTPTPGQSPGWPCACMVVVAAAWEACGAWAAAGAACALVDCAGPETVTFNVPEIGLRVSDPAREELACALRTSPGSMANRISGARDLVAHPELVELVASAAVSAWAARLVVREVEDLTDAQAAEVVAHVCAKVRQRRDSGRRSWTSAEIGRAARRARMRVCPDVDQEARQRAFAGRRVQVLPDRHGMATLIADLDATDAHRIHHRLSAIAAGMADPSDPGDPRTRDQLRADVLVDLLLGGDPTPGSAPRPEISVVMSLPDLLGVTDQPAHVPGHGPIPADLARTLAADATWRAWITDASGAVVAAPARGYVPTAAIARLVRAREPVCRMPGCRRQASGCDLDHTIAYPTGPTSSANIGPLCRRHHVLKTHMGWNLEPQDAGSLSRIESLDPTARDGASPGLDPPGPVAWRWRTPAGFTIRDLPDPPLVEP